MKRKKPYIRLTNSEFAMMQLLWEAGRPLNRAEIMEIASKRKTTCAMKTAGVALSFFFFTRIRPESA